VTSQSSSSFVGTVGRGWVMWLPFSRGIVFLGVGLFVSHWEIRMHFSSGRRRFVLTRTVEQRSLSCRVVRMIGAYSHLRVGVGVTPNTRVGEQTEDRSCEIKWRIQRWPPNFPLQLARPDFEPPPTPAPCSASAAASRRPQIAPAETTRSSRQPPCRCDFGTRDRPRS